MYLGVNNSSTGKPKMSMRIIEWEIWDKVN